MGRDRELVDRERVAERRPLDLLGEVGAVDDEVGHLERWPGPLRRRLVRQHRILGGQRGERGGVTVACVLQRGGEQRPVVGVAQRALIDAVERERVDRLRFTGEVVGRKVADGRVELVEQRLGATTEAGVAEVAQFDETVRRRRCAVGRVVREPVLRHAVVAADEGVGGAVEDEAADTFGVIGGEGGADDRAVAVAEVVELVFAERDPDGFEIGRRVGGGQEAGEVAGVVGAVLHEVGTVGVRFGAAVDHRRRGADATRIPADHVVGPQHVGRHAGTDPPRRLETRAARPAGVHHERAAPVARGRMPGERKAHRFEFGPVVEGVHRHLERRALPARRSESIGRRDAEVVARTPRERRQVVDGITRRIAGGRVVRPRWVARSDSAGSDGVAVSAGMALRSSTATSVAGEHAPRASPAAVTTASEPPARNASTRPPLRHGDSLP